MIAATRAGAYTVSAGAMGDSYTDEYSQIDPHGSTKDMYNWVEILVQAGRVDFGPVGVFRRGDPRYGAGGTSHEYNFALGGATTSSFLGRGPDYLYSQTGSPTQPEAWGGFRAYALAGVFDYGYEGIGGNDLIGGSFESTSGLFSGPGPLARGQADPVSAPEAWNLLRGVFERFWFGFDIATGGAGNAVRMVIGTVPDIAAMPFMNVLKGLFPQPEEALGNIRANVGLLNDWLEAEAAARGVPVLDLWGLFEEARTSGVSVDGTPIDWSDPAPNTTDLTQLDHFFLSDGLHPTPIGQGLMANEFLRALQDGYGEANVALLTDRELLDVTGLRPIPEPSVAVLLLASVACLPRGMRRKRSW